MRLPPPFYKLMLVTHRQQQSLADYLTFIDRCATAGITAVQLREKGGSMAHRIRFGQELKAILLPLNIPLIVNDDIELALKIDAEGVHLGQRDGCPKHARALLGPNKIIGVSIDSIDNLMYANQLPLDYVGIGAIFSTNNKQNIATHWGIKGLQALSGHSTHPVIGIGGINEKNAADVLGSGAQGIAVIGALHDSTEPAQTTAHLRAIVDAKKAALTNLYPIDRLSSMDNGG